VASVFSDLLRKEILFYLCENDIYHERKGYGFRGKKMLIIMKKGTFHDNEDNFSRKIQFPPK